jgi:hypothetical protein
VGSFGRGAPKQRFFASGPVTNLEPAPRHRHPSPHKVNGMEWSKLHERLTAIANQPQISDSDLIKAFTLAQDCPWLDISAASLMIDNHCPALNRRRSARNVTNIPQRHRREFLRLLLEAPINPASDYGLLANIANQAEITDGELGLATSIVQDATRNRQAIRALINEFSGPHARKHEPEYDIPLERRPDYISALLRMLDQ